MSSGKALSGSSTLVSRYVVAYPISMANVLSSARPPIFKLDADCSGEMAADLFRAQELNRWLLLLAQEMLFLFALRCILNDLG